jgi:hypothetical protein
MSASERHRLGYNGAILVDSGRRHLTGVNGRYLTDTALNLPDWIRPEPAIPRLKVTHDNVLYHG